MCFQVHLREPARALWLLTITPRQRWPRRPLRPLHHPRRCASPFPRTGPDSEKRARSPVPTRKSLRPRRTDLIIALTALTCPKATVLIVPINLVDSYAQDHTQRHGRSPTRRNSSLTQTRKPTTFPHLPTTTPSFPSHRPTTANRPWSGLIQRNLRNGVMVGELAR